MLTWFFLLLFLAVAAVAIGLAARSYMTGEPILGNFFSPKPEQRLEVVAQTSVDSRRKLVLIRRDGVEHLLMTGGPVDVVIETGIGAHAAVPATTIPRAIVKADPESTSASTPVFSRAPRNLGQVVNE